MADKFNLPGSSFEELQKIVKGYSNSSDNASLESLANLTGLNKTIVSASNKFLSDIGLISGGKRKLIVLKRIKMTNPQKMFALLNLRLPHQITG